MKILKMSITTNERVGANFTIREFELNETEKSYVSKGMRLDKQKILTVDSMFYNHNGTLSYHTYCKSEQKEEAMKLLMDEVYAKYNEIKKEFDELTEAVSMMKNSNLHTYLAEARIKDY